MFLVIASIVVFPFVIGYAFGRNDDPSWENFPG